MSFDNFWFYSNYWNCPRIALKLFETSDGLAFALELAEAAHRPPIIDLGPAPVPLGGPIRGAD